MGDFLITDHALPEILTMAIDTVLSRKLFHSIDCKKRQYPLHIHKHIEFIVTIHFLKKHFGKEKKKNPSFHFRLGLYHIKSLVTFFCHYCGTRIATESTKAQLETKFPSRKNLPYLC